MEQSLQLNVKIRIRSFAQSFFIINLSVRSLAYSFGFPSFIRSFPRFLARSLVCLFGRKVHPFLRFYLVTKKRFHNFPRAFPNTCINSVMKKKDVRLIKRFEENDFLFTQQSFNSLMLSVNANYWDYDYKPEGRPKGTTFPQHI